MNSIELITQAFDTRLTAKQLNLAIRIGALLHDGEHRFEGRPHVDGWLEVHSTALSQPLKVSYCDHSVIFEFANCDRSMFDSIRAILDDSLLFHAAPCIQPKSPGKPHSFERMSA
jgi:hypothetical protein